MATLQTASKGEIRNEIKEMFGIVPDWMEALPDTAFATHWGIMRDFYFAETEIPNKYKELIGIAVAGATRCSYCSFFHTEAARLFGATEDEIAEAAEMGGVSMSTSTFLNAMRIDMNEFKAQTREMVEYAREHMEQDRAQQSA